MTDRHEPTEEAAFLEAYDPARYDRPSVAVDVALLAIRDGALWTLLIRRGEHPDRGAWALPGVFVGIAEGLDEAAARALTTKAGVSDVFIEQLFTFGDPSRDPRTRVISVAYYALVEPAALERTAAGPDVRLVRLSVPWAGETGGPVDAIAEDGAAVPLAFDHDAILGLAVQRIRGKLAYAPIGFELLPQRFSLRDLRLVHEAILGRPLNKDSFRRTVLDRGLVVPTGVRDTTVGHRPPELYRFSDRQAR
jgi:8-oxo-dGTP diphosphatase